VYSAVACFKFDLLTEDLCKFYPFQQEVTGAVSCQKCHSTPFLHIPYHFMACDDIGQPASQHCLTEPPVLYKPSQGTEYREQQRSYPLNRILTEKLTARTASQEISRGHKSALPVPILSHMNLIHPPNSIFPRSVLILSSHLRLDLPSGIFRSGFRSKSRNIK
jgi:hypothetical protein